MTAHQTLAARAAVGIALALPSLLLPSVRSVLSSSRRAFDRGYLLAMSLSRIGIFVLIFFIAHLKPRGDVPAYYFDEGLQALSGKVIYRDFYSSYAPLHPYLDGALLHLWHNPLILMFVAVLVEIASIPLWLRLGRHLTSEHRFRVAAVLFLASPISLQYTTVDGQDNIIVALLLALSLWFLLKNRAALAGLSVAASIVAVKFLPLLFAPVYFLSVRSRWRLTAAAASLIALVYGICAVVFHAPILTPFHGEGSLRTCGNLPYLIESLFGITIPDTLLLAALVLPCILIWVFAANAARNTSTPTRVRILAFSMTALAFAILFFSKKSWPPYLTMTLFPLCIVASRFSQTGSKLRILIFTLFSFVAVTEHSVWATVFDQVDALTFHGMLLAHSPVAIGFLFLEILLLLGFAWFLLESLREVSAARSADILEAAPMTDRYPSDARVEDLSISA